MDAENVNTGIPPDIAAALHSIMSDVPNVEKAQRNNEQHYDYAGEADFMRAIRPLLKKHGLTFVPTTPVKPEFTIVETSSGKKMTRCVVGVQYTLLHKSGAVWDCPVMFYGEGRDSGDKALYKAYTGANKYFLFKLFQVPTGDDPEKDAAETTPAPAPAAATRQPAIKRQETGYRPKPDTDTGDVPPPAKPELKLYHCEASNDKATTTGKPRFSFKLENVGWASTFDTGMVSRCFTDKGFDAAHYIGPVNAAVFRKGEYWNISYIEPAEVAPAQQPPDQFDFASLGDLGPPLDMDNMSPGD